MECVVGHHGEQAFFSGELEKADFEPFHTDEDYAVCVSCGNNLCAKCMGDSYFMGTIDIDAHAFERRKS